MTDKAKREKHEAPEKPSWKARVQKSYQDRQPAGSRARALNQQDRVEFMKKHHPRSAADWAKYRGN